MIDTHCHLDHCDDPAAAAANDLAAMVTIGTTLERCRTNLALSETDERIFAAVGVHPNNASDAGDPDVRAGIEALARHERVVAIGETGFDTHWERETLASQRAAFDWQAALARELDLPLVLHVRDRQGREDASLAAVDALRDAGWERGILHCFNGHEALLGVGLDLGWMVSFAGNLTYRGAEDLRRAAARVPEARLLVETDSPFLSPEPRRGRSNVPANVRFTAARLAEVRGVPLERLEPVLDANAERIYRGLGRGEPAPRDPGARRPVAD